MPPGAKILIVEDEDYLRRLCRDVLALDGYEVLLAANGEEALALLRERTVDLIISDVAMAPIDGIELYERVCAEFPQLKKRFVIMTAVVGAEQRINRWQDRPVVLQKPFQLHTLRALVRSFFEPL